MSRASIATSSRVLARGSAVMPRAAASSEIVRGQRGVAVGEPAGVVAGEAHVQAPVAEVEVGMVVGRLGRVGDLADEGDRVDEGRGHEPGLDPLQQDAPVGQVVAAGELRRRVPISHAVDRIQERSVRDVPEAEALRRRDRRGRRPVARLQDRLGCPPLGPARGRPRRRCRRSSGPSGGRRRWPRSRSAARPSPRSVHPARRTRRTSDTGSSPAAAFGRRQNALKSCSPRNGSQASVSSSRSSGTGHVPRGGGQERIGHRPVEHRVAVGAAGGGEASVEVGRRHADLAHDDRRAAQLHQRALQRRRGRPTPAGRATPPAPTRARPGRCARRR